MTSEKSSIKCDECKKEIASPNSNKEVCNIIKAIGFGNIPSYFCSKSCQYKHDKDLDESFQGVYHDDY